MFGFLKEEEDHVAVADRIFEMCLLNLFMAKEAITSDVFSQGETDRIGFIKNGRLDMELVLRKFVAENGSLLTIWSFITKIRDICSALILTRRRKSG